MTTTGATGGWRNRSAYPLMVSQIVDHALVKMQADRNLSRGKALNVAIEEGLASLGYLTRPKTPEQLRDEANQREIQWVKDNWAMMTEKARRYWAEKHPLTAEALRGTVQASPAV